MNVSELKTWFQHPQNPSSKVHVIFDVCHVIKLMRNWKQYGGLVLPSPEVLRILKATEVIFKWRVINTE